MRVWHLDLFYQGAFCANPAGFKIVCGVDGSQVVTYKTNDYSWYVHEDVPYNIKQDFKQVFSQFSSFHLLTPWFILPAE